MNSRVRTYTNLFSAMQSNSLKAAMEYRIAFITQVAGMVLNDICWMGLWWLFFQRFPSANGWGFKDTVVLFSLGGFMFGIQMWFFGGCYDLCRSISRGEFDYYLSLPKDPLLMALISRSNIPALGDLVFGLIGFAFVNTHGWQGWVAFFVAAILGTTLFLSYCIVTQSLGFFLSNFERGAQNLFWSIITFSIYPINSYRGALKVLMCTLVPAYFIYAVPMRLINDFDLSDLLILVVLSIASLFFAVHFFRYGLKRYESGNLVMMQQ